MDSNEEIFNRQGVNEQGGDVRGAPDFLGFDLLGDRREDYSMEICKPSPNLL